MYNWKKHTNYRNSVDPEPQSPQLQPLFINMGESPTSGTIRVVENKIFFYGEIDSQSMLELNRLLWEIDIKVQNTKNILGAEYNPIVHLHMNTPGGSLLDAFSCVDSIRSLRSPVYTYVEGMVASAGTLICAVGAKRYIGKHSHMLIHQLSGIMGGTFEEMEDQFMNSSVLMKMLKDFYKEYTKIPMKRLDEILKRDLLMSPTECVQYGMVDEII